MVTITGEETLFLFFQCSMVVTQSIMDKEKEGIPWSLNGEVHTSTSLHMEQYNLHTKSAIHTCPQLT